MDSHLPCGLVARIRGSHPRGPGSIPGTGKHFVFLFAFFSMIVAIFFVTTSVVNNLLIDGMTCQSMFEEIPENVSKMQGRLTRKIHFGCMRGSPHDGDPIDSPS